MTKQEGSYISLGGVETWVDRQGSGEAVLLLHGGFSHSEEWATSLARLADAYDVIAYDRRGHGRTADTDDWDREALVSDAVALLDELQVRSAHVVGYSDGGVVAAGLAQAHPNRVASLALLSTALTPEDWLHLPDSPDSGDPLDALPRQVIDEYRRVSPDGVSRLPHVLERAAALAREAHGDALDAYSGRILVLCGDDDLVTLASQVRTATESGDADLAVIPHASHDAPREHPDLVLRLVRDFLSGRSAPTHIPVRRAGARTR